MMNKMLCLLIFLGACATVETTQNDFYHRLNLKPSITEKVTDTEKMETVHNPYDLDIKLIVSCDLELNDRILNIKSEKDISFTVPVDSQGCTIERWEVK